MQNAKTYVMYTSQQSRFNNLVRSPKIGVVRFPPAVWIYCNLVHSMYKRLSLDIRSSSSIVIFDTLQKEKHKKLQKANQCVSIVFLVIFLFGNILFLQSLPFIQRDLFWKYKFVDFFFVHTHPFQPRTSLHYIVANPILTCNKGIVGYPASTQGVVTNCCRCPSTQCTVTTK